MSNAMAVTDTSFDNEVLQSSTPVVVDFWAEWCGPCKLIAPVLDELAGEYEGKVKIAKLNVDENPEVASKFRVRSIPTLRFFREGQIVDQVIGAASKTDLKKRLDAAIA